MSKSIGLDLDGCLYNWPNAVYEYYQVYRDYSKSLTDFWTHEITKISKAGWDFLTNVDIFYSSQLPTEDCINFLNNIKYRFDIYYVTSRPELVKLTTEQYLRRYKFPFRDNLIFTDNKVNEVRRLGLSYCVDDMPHHVEALAKVTNIIMIAQPWNKYLWDKYPTAHSLMSALQYMED
jgi:uncharacterized HAD superfamily protein